MLQSVENTFNWQSDIEGREAYESREGVPGNALNVKSASETQGRIGVGDSRTLLGCGLS